MMLIDMDDEESKMTVQEKEEPQLWSKGIN